MTELVVDVYHGCEHSEQSEEEYGSWQEDWSFAVGNRAMIVTEKGYPYPNAVYTDGELEPGETVYAIIANWGGGNSFGFANGKYMDVVIVHRDSDIALENLKLLKKASEEGGPVPLTRDNGEAIPYRPGWLGYFESLDSLAIYTLTVVGEGCMYND